MKIKQLLALGVVALSVFSLNAAQATNDEIKNRIKPVGSVHIAGAVAASAAAAGPKSGKDIYNSACTACHAAGVLGAPKSQNAADWKPRLDEKGFDTVWQNAIKGINAMPPMGTCGTCTDDDIKAAIEYMIEGVE